MKYWGKAGALWGGFWSLLFGAGVFVIPGIGPIVVAGPLVSWIVGALEGAAITGGLSAVGAAIYGIGVPKDSVLQYDTALKTGRFVLIAHGTAEETARARELIARGKPESLSEAPVLRADYVA
jgi:hypothetical protein